jgi:hypothetical protein
MNFDSSSASAPQKKKTFNDLAVDFYPYWKPYFESIGQTNPVYKTKLAYNAKECLDENGNKQPAVRFFESELNLTTDIYVECVDWDQNFYDPMNRTLYKFTPNPHWKGEPDKFVRSDSANYPTYAVRLSELEIVNMTSITEKTPRVMTNTTPSVELEEEFELQYQDMDDNHLSSLTIRDQYCIQHNVPLSNKQWLNSLILKGRKWLKENQ